MTGSIARRGVLAATGQQGPPACRVGWPRPAGSLSPTRKLTAYDVGGVAADTGVTVVAGVAGVVGVGVAVVGGIGGAGVVVTCEVVGVDDARELVAEGGDGG